MAEACRLGNRDTENKTSNNQNENFCVFNVLCVFISLISILADLTTGMSSHTYLPIPILYF